MKLGTKLIFYNSVTKIVIITLLGIMLPEVVERVVYNFIDSKLQAKKEKVLNLIKRGGINEIVLEEDCTYGNYTLLKQEYVYIKPIPKYENILHISDTTQAIEQVEYPFRTLSYSFIHDNQYYLLEIGEGLRSIERIKETLKTFVFWTLIGVLVVTITVDIGFTRLILRPFNQIITRKLKPAGHPNTFNTEPVFTTTQDFAYLDQSINELMERIKHAFLIEKEFIANASHELLTPISVLQSKLENMLAIEELPDEAALKVVETQSILVKLTKIVRVLLMISKIENEQYLKTDKVELKSLLAEVAEDIEERLEEHQIALKMQLQDNFTITNCNKTLLYTLFFNIVNNAIRYNKENGSIIISSLYEGGRHGVAITDTGIGMTAEKLPVIFDRFKKVGAGGKEEGYGLGLSIVKTIAEFHKLELKVSSETGVGTVFKILFPVA